MTEPTPNTQPQAETPAAAPEPLYVDPEQASTNFYWTAGKKEIFNFQTTIRGTLTQDQIDAHLSTVIASCQTITNAYGGHAKQIGNGAIKTEAAPAAAKPAAPAGPSAPGKPAAPDAAAAGQPAAPAAGAPLTLVTNRIEVTPKPDGKAEIKFYVPGHNFPDLSSTKQITSWITMLATTGAWGAEHFDSPLIYNIALKVSYHLSTKLNTLGKPYKDIDKIELPG